MLHQQDSEGFGADIAAFKFGQGQDGFGTSFRPTGNVLANVIEHTQFRVAAAQQLSIEILRRRFVARQKALQCEARARAFHQNGRIFRTRERVQDQGRKAERFGGVIHDVIARWLQLLYRQVWREC